MATHNDTGKRGEALAACWLIMQGYQILHHNWRVGRYEIDLIARRNGVLHFVEVKTGTGTGFGYPEDRINKRKWKTFQRCGEQYLHDFEYPLFLQFDIISIVIRRDQVSYLLLEDVFTG